MFAENQKSPYLCIVKTKQGVVKDLMGGGDKGNKYKHIIKVGDGRKLRIKK